MARQFVWVQTVQNEPKWWKYKNTIINVSLKGSKKNRRCLIYLKIV